MLSFYLKSHLFQKFNAVSLFLKRVFLFIPKGRKTFSSIETICLSLIIMNPRGDCHEEKRFFAVWDFNNTRLHSTKEVIYGEFSAVGNEKCKFIKNALKRSIAENGLLRFWLVIADKSFCVSLKLTQFFWMCWKKCPLKLFQNIVKSWLNL
jgi:hypothetical protein